MRVHEGAYAGGAEYMTPPWLCEVIREHAGGQIDLDPCTTELFNRHGIKAKNFIEPPADGLEPQWYGTVYVNPPGGHTRPGVKVWYEKLLYSQAKQGYFLSFSLSSLQWSQSVIPISTYQCVVFGKRLKFWETVEQSAAALARHSKPSKRRLQRLRECGSPVVESACPVSPCMLTWIPIRGYRDSDCWLENGVRLRNLIRDAGHRAVLL